MLSDSEKIEDLKEFLTHLSTIHFSGTMMLTFTKGSLSSVSKKDDLIPGKLREVARKSVYVRLKKPEPEAAAIALPESKEVQEEVKP